MSKKRGTLNAFLSVTGQLLANVQGRNEGGARGAQFLGRRITKGTTDHCGGRRMTAG